MLDEPAFSKMQLIIGYVNVTELRILANVARNRNIPFINVNFPNDGGITNNPEFRHSEYDTAFTLRSNIQIHSAQLGHFEYIFISGRPERRKTGSEMILRKLKKIQLPFR